MKAIVAVDENWAIGKDNQLLFHIKEDLKQFKTLTMDKAIVMGRKTFESLPGKKPLKGRDNYILTRDTNYSVEGATVVNSYSEFLTQYANKYPPSEIFVIGGSEIYKLFFDSIDEVYLTKIHSSVEGADTFFPNLDELDKWELMSHTDIYKDENGLEYQFMVYHIPDSRLSYKF